MQRITHHRFMQLSSMSVLHQFWLFATRLGCPRTFKDKIEELLFNSLQGIFRNSRSGTNLHWKFLTLNSTTCGGTQQLGCYPQRSTPGCFHRFLAGLVTLRILLAKQTLAEPCHREEKQTHPVEQVLEEVEQVCGVGLSPDCCSCRQ